MQRRLLVTLSAAAVIAATYAFQAVGHEPSRGRPAAGEAGLSGLDVPIGATAAGGAADPATRPGPDGRRSLNDQIAFWASRVSKVPSDFLSLLHLAVAEAAKARLTA